MIPVSIMQYDNHLDDTIIRILNDNKIIQKYAWTYTKTEKRREELHFKGILKAVEEYYRKVTHSMLSLHLTMLEKENIIERDKEFKNGHARFHRLTNNTKLALELELPIPKVRSKREENRRKKKNNNNL